MPAARAGHGHGYLLSSVTSVDVFERRSETHSLTVSQLHRRTVSQRAGRTDRQRSAKRWAPIRDARHAMDETDERNFGGCFLGVSQRMAGGWQGKAGQGRAWPRAHVGVSKGLRCSYESAEACLAALAPRAPECRPCQPQEKTDDGRGRSESERLRDISDSHSSAPTELLTGQSRHPLGQPSHVHQVPFTSNSVP